MEQQSQGDPAMVRVGMNLGGGDAGITMADLMTVMNELMARMLNLARLSIVIVPIVHQSCYMHSVDFLTWNARLMGITACVGVVCMAVAPEQFFNGMAMRHWRWAFERIYPEAKDWSGGILADGSSDQASGASLLRGGAAVELDGRRVCLRWHGTRKFLGVSREGWAVAGEERHKATWQFEQVTSKGGQKVADTYKLRVDDPIARWHDSRLSFSALNQLRLGGWAGVYWHEDDACPYKLVVDSACPPGTCKLLAAWPKISPVTQRYCTGFYLAEQICGSRSFVGHAPDVDAALLEICPVTEMRIHEKGMSS